MPASTQELDNLRAWVMRLESVEVVVAGRGADISKLCTVSARSGVGVGGAAEPMSTRA